MANAIIRRHRADTKRAPHARSPGKGLRGTSSSGARPRPRHGNSRGVLVIACHLLPLPPCGGGWGGGEATHSEFAMHPPPPALFFSPPPPCFCVREGPLPPHG